MKKRIVTRLIIIGMALIVAMSFGAYDQVSAAIKKPTKVKGVRVEKVTYMSATIKWDKAEHAKKYEVYRSLHKKTGYELIKTLKKTSFKDTNLKTGTKYWYRVRAINKKYQGKKSQCVQAVPTLKTPTLTVTGIGDGIILKINPVKGAIGYYLYKDDERLVEQRELTYTDEDTVVGEEHSYSVVAFRMVDEEPIESDRSEEISGARAKLSIKLSGANKVKGPVEEGSPYTIKGKIISNTTIKRVHIGVKDISEEGEETWCSGTHFSKKDVNAREFDIAEADSSVKFGKLPIGTHYYVIKVTLNDGTVKELRKQQFEVVEKAPEPEIVFPKEVTKGAKKAVKWARAIANDDSFAYGTGSRSHRGGCYFCGTNTGPNMKKKEKSGEKHYVKDSSGKKHTYEKTYCCNPFIFAAYAHGAKDPQILKACKKGKCGGMETSDWTRYGCFAVVGACKKVPYKKLLPGDVIISDKNKNGHYHHVIMDAGNNQYVEAGWEGWGSSTIAVRSGAKENYNKHYRKYKGCYVLRYIGK